MMQKVRPASCEKNWKIGGVHAATLPAQPTTSRPDAPLTSVEAPLERPPRGLDGFPSKLPVMSLYERLVEFRITLNGNPEVAFPVRKQRGQQLHQLRRLHLTYRSIIQSSSTNHVIFVRTLL
jgi:hypothetical protein